MSRSAAGTYSLPFGDVVTGTAISVTWANGTMDDLEVEMSDSLSRSGKGGMTSVFRGIDGTVSAPALSWTSETSSGLYRASAGNVRFSILGADILTVVSAGISVAGTLSATGTITGPSGSWSATGIDLATTDSYFIDGNNVLSQTALGSTVLASSLTSVGTLAALTVTGTAAAGTVTGANVTTGADPGHTHTAYQPTGNYLLDTTDTFTGTLTVAGTVAATAVTGAIDGIVGGNTPAAGTFTTLTGTTFVGLPASSETASGIIELATQVEADAGTDALRAITPATLSNYPFPEAEAASTTVSGISEMATVAETNAGTDDTRSVTPDGLDGWTGSAQVTTVGTIGTGTWNGTAIDQTYLTGQSGTNTGDETLSSVNALGVTSVGTIATGVWNGTAIDQTYLTGQSGTNTGDEVAASETVSGIIELATQAEVNAGTDALRALTPATLAAYSGLGSGATEATITETTHGFAVLDAVRYNGTNWVKAQADDANTTALGVVIAVADVNTFTYAITGRYEITHGITADEWYYLDSAVAGDLTATEPNISQPLVYTEGASFVSIYAYRPTGTSLGYLSNVVEDVTPQLGGNLDFNGNLATTFTSTGIDDNATSTAITISSGQVTSFSEYIDIEDRGAQTGEFRVVHENDVTTLTSNGSAAFGSILLKLNDGGSAATRLGITTTATTLTNSDLVIGTSGKGIDFSATSDAAGSTSELLDDYEEGTWTPVLSDGTNNATMSGSASGVYTKTGNLVTVNAYVRTTSIASCSGVLRVTGLPYTCGHYSSGAVGLGVGLTMTAGRSLAMYLATGQAYMEIHVWDAYGGTTGMLDTEWGAGANGYIMLSVSYTI